MKLQFDQALKGVDGKELMGEGGKAVMLKQVVQTALLNTSPNDTASGEEKAKRWQLAMQIEAAKELDLDLSPEDVSLIRRLVGQSYGPVVVGPVYQILN